MPLRISIAALLQALNNVVLVAVLGVVLVGVVPRRASARHLSEYEVKAVFLFNFTKFVEWPAAVLADGTSPIVIGVVGDDPFGWALDDAVRGKTVDGHAIVVTRVRAKDDFAGLHILFISKSETAHVSQILQRLERASVLTVSDIDRFSTTGGVIGFVTEHDGVTFRINVAAAQRGHLKISSRLLMLAAVTYGDGG